MPDAGAPLTEIRPFSNTRSSSLRFEQRRGELRHLRLHLGAGHVQRRAADGLRAAAERADALLHDRRVAVLDRDVLDRHAELIGQHLRERRLVALAVRRGAGRGA